MKSRALALVALLALISGCRTEPAEPAEPAPVAAVAAPDEVANPAADSNEFAVALYGQLRREPGNIIISPYSISAALAMTYDGARGETAEEMARVLHFPRDRARLHPTFAALTARLTQRTDGNILNVANALWGQTGYPFEQDFLDTTARHYGAGFKPVDFCNPPEACRIINEWVKRETRDRIQEILPVESVDPDATRLVLTNAIFFKGAWAQAFPKNATRPGDFHCSPGRTVSVPMMSVSGKELPYSDNDECQILELPYRGRQISMVFFLPHKGSSLESLERSLTAASLAGRLRALTSQTVDVSMPRLKIEQSCQLNNALNSLGMRRAFSDADFSGITTAEPLFISDVFHKANLELDEDGAIAAAATAVVFAVDTSTPDDTQFIADRPFLFLIRDRSTDTILFMGRVVDPGK